MTEDEIIQNTQIIQKWSPIIEKILESINKEKTEKQIKFLCAFCDHYTKLQVNSEMTINIKKESYDNLPTGPHISYLSGGTPGIIPNEINLLLFALKRLVLTNIHETNYDFVNRNTITGLVKYETLTEIEKDVFTNLVNVDIRKITEQKLGEEVDRQLALIDFTEFSNVTISKFMDIQHIGNEFIVFSNYDCFK